MAILLVFQVLVFFSDLVMLLASDLCLPSRHPATTPVSISLAETPPKAPLTEQFLTSDLRKIQQINLLDQL